MANWATVQNMGDPSSPEWQRDRLMEIMQNGQKWVVNTYAAQAFQGLLKELADRGYPLKSSGGFNYRNIRGGNRLSQHAFGNAIDVNADTNPLGSAKTDLPSDIGDIAAKYGLEWGGHWKSRPDPMHFEWRGSGGVGPNMVLPAGAAATGAPNAANPVGDYAFAGAKVPPVVAAPPVAGAPQAGFGAYDAVGTLAGALSGLGKMMAAPKAAQVAPKSGPVGLGGPVLMPMAQRLAGIDEPVAVPKSKTLAARLSGLAL